MTLAALTGLPLFVVLFLGWLAISLPAAIFIGRLIAWGQARSSSITSGSS